MTERKDFRAGLQPPRFGLVTLLVVMTVLCVFSAAIKFFGAHGAIGVVVLLFAALAHLAAAALGAQLRANGSRPLPNEDGELPEHARRRELTDDDFAPSTRLSQYESLGRLTLTLTGLGAVFGAAAGTAFFLFLYWEKAEVWNIGAGALAFAILGGIATFAAVGFIKASVSAVAQASGERRPRPSISRKES